MEAMREAWTDDRLDDLNHRVGDGFGRSEREFQAIRLEMRTEFASVRSEMHAEFTALRSQLQGEFAAVRAEANTMHRTLLQVILGGFAVMGAGFAGTIATIITQV